MLSFFSCRRGCLFLGVFMYCFFFSLPGMLSAESPCDSSYVLRASPIDAGVGATLAEKRLCTEHEAHVRAQMVQGG